MSKRKKPTATVVTTERRFAMSKRTMVRVLLLSLVLIALGAVIFALVGMRDDKADDRGGATQGAVDVEQQLKDGYAQADYGQVVGALTAQDAADPAARLQLAVAYYNDKQYAKSLEVFDELNKAGKLASADLETAAQAAEAQGEKTRAVNFYRVARQKVAEEKLVTAESRIEYYDQQIKRLGGQ